MNRSAFELVNEVLIPVKLLSKKIERHGSGWDIYGPYKFETDEILIVRIVKYGRSELMHLVAFDDKTKTEKAYIVPPNFMMDVSPTPQTEKLIKSYEDHLLSFMHQNLAFGGSIGSDPEIFVEDQAGEIVPAFNFLGSKKEPSKAPGYSYGANNCYWDGFQAEFDTSAQTCMGWHADSIQAGLLGIYEHMKKYNKNAKLSSKTVFDIPYDLLKSSKPEHVEFGCFPSLNAYGMKGIAAAGAEVLYRSAGGHIHFGIPNMTADRANKIVKALDAVLGVAGVSLFAKYDNPKRREMYGLAGEYRLPKHGIEYRVLSNAWLFHPLAANLVFDLARSVVSFGDKNYLKYWQGTEAETIRIINECDVPAARKILEANKDILTKIANARYNNFSMASFVYNTIINGIDDAVVDMSNIADNWRLGVPRAGSAGGEKGWITHCNNGGNNVYSSHLILPETIKKQREAIELAKAAVPIFHEVKK